MILLATAFGVGNSFFPIANLHKMLFRKIIIIPSRKGDTGIKRVNSVLLPLDEGTMKGNILGSLTYVFSSRERPI